MNELSIFDPDFSGSFQFGIDLNYLLAFFYRFFKLAKFSFDLMFVGFSSFDLMFFLKNVLMILQMDLMNCVMRHLGLGSLGDT